MIFQSCPRSLSRVHLCDCLGGLIIALGVAPLTVWLMGKMRGPAEPATFERRGTPDYVWRVALLAIVIYPALYLLAGHFIAWQFADVRELYTGSTANRSFMASLRPFLTDGLWFTQIVRGLLWIGLGLPVVWMTRDGFPRSGLVLGLLFAVLMNAQLCCPTPLCRIRSAWPTASKQLRRILCGVSRSLGCSRRGRQACASHRLP